MKEKASDERSVHLTAVRWEERTGCSQTYRIGQFQSVHSVCKPLLYRWHTLQPAGMLSRVWSRPTQSRHGSLRHGGNDSSVTVVAPTHSFRQTLTTASNCRLLLALSSGGETAKKQPFPPLGVAADADTNGIIDELKYLTPFKYNALFCYRIL